MPSSRTEDLLVQIAASYTRAREQLEADDLEAVGATLNEVDVLLRRVGPPAQDSESDRAARTVATEAYTALNLAIVEDARQTGILLAQTRRGQRALSGYGSRQDVIGSRVERDA